MISGLDRSGEDRARNSGRARCGERDQSLIRQDGETLSGVQHLPRDRMIRAKMPEESPPRVEVDVAGFAIARSRDCAR